MGIDRRSLQVPGILDLTKRSTRLLIPDQRGHGDSSRGFADEYTHGSWVTDARELIRILGLSRVALLGHSYGGFLALEYASRWPETLTHLILVATSAGPVRRPVRTFKNDSELREYFSDVWPRFFSGAEKYWSFFDTLRFSAETYNAAFARELSAYDVRRHIESLTVPILLIVGSDDPYLSDMRWIAEHAPRSRLHVLNGVGHFPFVEAPDQFAEIVSGFVQDTIETAG